ncbi:hypothetical protein JXI42_05570 [bacterium]|nr:hypothetical protein [bacterium]
MKRLYISIIIVPILWASCAFGLDYEPSSIFLLRPQSAEQAAMAEIGTGLPSHNCLQFNPGATVLGDGISANLMYNFHFQDIRTNSANLYWRKMNFTLGVDFFLSNISGIEKRSAATPEPDYVFTSHSLYLGFLAGYTVLQRVSIGMRVKWLYERIDYDDADGTVLDFGILVRQKFLNQTFTLGGAILNFGQDFRFIEYQFRMPKVYRTGIGVEFNDPSFKVGFDFIKPEFDDFQYAFGGEYNVVEWLNLRAGYVAGHDSRSVTAGLSLLYRNISFNYAFVPYRYKWGFSHLISFGYSSS